MPSIKELADAMGSSGLYETFSGVHATGDRHALLPPMRLWNQSLFDDGELSHFPTHLIHQPFQAHRILPKAHGGIPSSTATPLHNTSERSLPTPDAAAPPVKLHSPPLCGQVGKSMRELQCARVGVCQRQRSTTGAQLAHVLM